MRSSNLDSSNLDNFLTKEGRVCPTFKATRKVCRLIAKLICYRSSAAAYKLASHRTLALTRDASSLATQTMANLPGAEIVEKNWVEINDTWLRDHEVVRIFSVSHVQPKRANSL